MLNYFNNLFGLKSMVKTTVAIGQAGLMAGLAILTIPALQSASPAAERSMPQQTNAESVGNHSLAREAKLVNGVYLYGQAAQPDQIGSTYMVFEVTNGKVVGAMYMPSSSFDCFQGALQSDRLAFNLIDSYSHKTYAASIPLEKSPLVASTSGVAIEGMQLKGFHSISVISTNDQRLLSTCKADFRK